VYNGPVAATPRKEGNMVWFMVSLTWWEKFIVDATLSLLMDLQAKITNASEQAAITSVIAFLQKLGAGSVASV
jgi:hypothetical protein